MKICYSGMDVVMNLEKGVYAFLSRSGIGKSFLAKIFNNALSLGVRVCSYTYEDYIREFPIKAVLDSHKYDIVMLNRYDMYYGVGVNDIVGFSKDGTVLLDCKDKLPLPKVKACTISFTRERMEVLDLGFYF